MRKALNRGFYYYSREARQKKAQNMPPPEKGERIFCLELREDIFDFFENSIGNYLRNVVIYR
ncbi:MAG: hypothetical protein IJZ91_01900 [Oscillospiraceae bacterium]|nr:hypothetical protein [Oscillospiraceae bacterium]